MACQFWTLPRAKKHEANEYKPDDVIMEANRDLSAALLCCAKQEKNNKRRSMTVDVVAMQFFHENLSQ